MNGPRIRIKITPPDCSGCLSCMTVCSMTNESFASLSAARVHVELRPFEGIHQIAICRQCDKARCALVCPVGAIARTNEGIWAVDHSRCTAGTEGCRACISACPFHAIYWNGITGEIINCELCQGNPRCVQACATGALEMEALRGNE